MKKIKNPIEQFEKLEPDAKKIRHISEHQEIREIDQKKTDLEQQLKEVLAKLNDCYVGFASPSQRHSVDEDAKAILSGTPLDELPGQTVDSKKANLARQKDALEKSVAMVEQQKRHAEREIIQRAYIEIEPFSEKYVGAVIDAFENLKVQLENLNILIWFLRSKGFNPLPEGVTIWPYEQRLINGGGGLMPLESYLICKLLLRCTH